MGYVFGALLAKMFRQSGYDIIAISVETGVQNTGISIYLLKFALEAPESDIAQGKISFSKELVKLNNIFADVSKSQPTKAYLLKFHII